MQSRLLVLHAMEGKKAEVITLLSRSRPAEVTWPRGLIGWRHTCISYALHVNPSFHTVVHVHQTFHLCVQGMLRCSNISFKGVQRMFRCSDIPFKDVQGMVRHSIRECPWNAQMLRHSIQGCPRNAPSPNPRFPIRRQGSYLHHCPGICERMWRGGGRGRGGGGRRGGQVRRRGGKG